MPAIPCCAAGGAFAAAILMVLCAGGCAPKVRIVQSGQPVDFQPHSKQLQGWPADMAHVSARRTLDVGRSADGGTLAVEVFGSGPKTVLVLGGIHGDETRSVEVARFLAGYLAATPEAVLGKTVAVLSDVNPSGAARRTRTNASGVDLNRNFAARNWRPGAMGRRDYPGPSPGSEPETQAIICAFERLRPGRIISLHATARDEPCNNFDGPAEGLARLMAAQNGYPVLANIGHPTPGSLGSWAGIDRGVPVITLELPESRPGAECWDRNRGALLEAISADAPAPPAAPVSSR
jgi:protein MpaA